jgi:hypothetical protein
MARCFLVYAGETLDKAIPYATKGDACRAYMWTALELDRVGQSIDAAIHIAPTRDEMAEYPDFVLSLGARRNLRCERT